MLGTTHAHTHAGWGAYDASLERHIAEAKLIIYIDRSTRCVKKLPLAEELAVAVGHAFHLFCARRRPQDAGQHTCNEMRERENKKNGKSPHVLQKKIGLEDAGEHVYGREILPFCTDSALARSVILRERC